MSILAAILALAMSAAEADVRVVVEPPVIPFHEWVDYTIIVEAPADELIQFPAGKTDFGGLEAFGEPVRAAEELPGGRKRVSLTYRVEGIEPGDYMPGPAEVSVGDETVSVLSPVIRLRELTPDEEAELETMASNAPPITPDLPPVSDWRYWAGGIVLVILIGAAVAYLLARRKRVETAPPRPSWEVAYERLRALDERALPEKGEADEYYVVLSDIVRTYIEDRFHIRAPEQTTPEFLTAASTSGVLSAEHEALLSRFMRRCDRVKFARFTPERRQMEEDFTDILTFVDETVPKEVPGEPEEAAA